MTTKSEYMLVMVVTPPNLRSFKTRIFVHEDEMSSGHILDREVAVAKQHGVDPKNVITVNVVKLQ